MLKFTIDSKELKTMIEKVVTVIPKKTVASALERLYFQVYADDIVRIFGTDLDQWLEVGSQNVYNTKPGIIGISIDDIKIITKMNGEVTIVDNGVIDGKEESGIGSVNVMCGKKCITIPRYSNTEEIKLPVMESEKKCAVVKENYLYETIVNLATFTMYDNNNKLLNSLHFNLQKERIEATDRTRIATRTLENQQIINKENNTENFVLSNKCATVFKKLLDKKSDDGIVIYQDEKYIRVSGNDFTYISRKIDGRYIDIEPFMNIDTKWNVAVDKAELLEVMKYDYDLVKGTHIPVIFYNDNNDLYLYTNNKCYVTLDEIETQENTMDDAGYIALNPSYMIDVLKIINEDDVIIRGINEKSPVYIKNDEYEFMLLLVTIKEDNIDHVKMAIERNKQNKRIA